ncbi:MAG: 50S ribosomal protein L29 [Clostridia bacterium]|nr:50S ribosomal protein L29 [Clostridia bacterium]
MKVKEYNEKLAEMTLEELMQEEEDLKKELFNLRFQQVTAYMDNPLKLRLVKHDIARVKTAISKKSKEA